MNVTVIIPVGPGHEDLSERAAASAWKAWKVMRGPFTVLDVVRVADHEGRLGRSRARNRGMDLAPWADYHFLLDADDAMMMHAFALVDTGAAATFGAVCADGLVHERNRFPCDRETLFQHGADGTLSMGFFVRRDLGLRFNEDMDVGEDFDFYMRLPNFTKVEHPLVSIGYRHPSAGGPRGYTSIDWLGECRKVVDGYRAAVPA